jgi:hypothetical protein
MPAYAIDTGTATVVPYEHTQASPSSDWVIDHFLGRHPVSVLVVDTAGTTILGDVEFNSINRVTAHFSAPFGGKAYVL